MTVPDEFKHKVQQAADDETYMLRDEQGILYWVDNTDDEGIYYHADEGDTHRCSWSQAYDWFELLTVDENDYKIN